MRSLLRRVHRILATGQKCNPRKVDRYSLCNYQRNQFMLLRRFSTSPLRVMGGGFVGVEDRYRGIHVEMKDDMPTEEFESKLAESLDRWYKEDKLSVWLEVPIHLSHYIPIAARHGFNFHHAEGECSTLSKWLNPELPNLLPRFATHQVGVAGCIVREDTGEVLVIQDRHRHFQLWKFPGGLADLGEDISETAEREVYEETGIRAEFQGIMTFRQQHNLPGAFGRSDMYFLCYMKPLTFEIKPDTNEILRCVWMKIDDLQNDAQTTAMTQRVGELLKTGLDYGFDKVVLTSPEFKSVYKDVKYKLHHVDIGLSNCTKPSYVHYISSSFPRD